MNCIEAMKALLEGKRIREKGRRSPFMEIVGGELVSEFGGGGTVHSGVEYEEVDVREEIQTLSEKGGLVLEELERIRAKISSLEARIK